MSPTEAGELGLQVRPARPDECVAVADLYLRVRRDNLGAIPPVVHSDDCVRDWFSTVLLERDEAWVAVEQTDGDNEEGAPDVRYRLEETSIRG
ncbi:MAG: hypothetical protein M3O94_01655 [Actinomycetota bacterium]|nr:hypothetical protein [Actinomycetota bacterium]